MNEVQQPTTSVGITYDAYGGLQNQNLDYNVGRKRKLYFLFLVVGFQVFLTFWLSKHLILSWIDLSLYLEKKKKKMEQLEKKESKLN